MSPLESYLETRMDPSARTREAWQHRIRKLPAPLRSFISRKLWKWPYRHMRSFPWDARMEPAEPGAWNILRDGKTIATTIPMDQWIGRIDRPVTIIAGGPTAREYPLRELANGERFIIAVNGVPALLDEAGVHADAWVVADVRLARQIEANFPHAKNTPLALPATVAAAIALHNPAELAKHPLCVIERINQWHGLHSLEEHELIDLNQRSGSPFLFPAQGGGKSVVGWSHRPDLGFFSGSTVVFTALQIAIGLGARDVEIIGMDLSGKSHAYGEQKGSLASSLENDYETSIVPAFNMMHQALKGKGVAVRNLSPVCPLPAAIFDL